MKGLVYCGNEVLEWKEVQDVTPKDDEVKIKVKAAGICGSDVHGYQGITGRRIPPMIMGHKFSSIITQVGKDVKTLKIGDRVAPYPVDYCGECSFCQKGTQQLCPTRRQFGVLTVDGAFAEYICVPAKVCFKLNDNISFSAGSTVEPLAVAFRGVKQAGNIEGKNILIVGSGTIGLMALACVKAQKPNRVFISDLSNSRLAVAKLMDADFTLNSSESDIKETILANTGGLGVDISVEAVGITPTCVQSVENLRIGGKTVWLGQSKKIVEIGMLDIVTRDLTICGSFMYGVKEFESAVNILNQGKIDVEPLISKEVPMSEGAEWFEKLKKPESLVKVILRDEE